MRLTPNSCPRGLQRAKYIFAPVTFRNVCFGGRAFKMGCNSALVAKYAKTSSAGQSRSGAVCCARNVAVSDPSAGHQQVSIRHTTPAVTQQPSCCIAARTFVCCGGGVVCRPRCGSHKPPRATCGNRPQATSHKPQATGHKPSQKPQATSHTDNSVNQRNNTFTTTLLLWTWRQREFQHRTYRERHRPPCDRCGAALCGILWYMDRGKPHVRE